MTEEFLKTEDEWKASLTEEQYRVCRLRGTEAAFSGEYNDCKMKGTYTCVCCGAPLFASETKFNSGTGWPSFYAPHEANNVGTTIDTSHGMQRIEVHCDHCKSHLGHLFEDGPEPSGKRYCINSVSLKLVPTE